MIAMVINRINDRVVNTVVIDGCEYILYVDSNQNEYITHKGNCQQCKEKMYKMFTEVNNNFSNMETMVERKLVEHELKY